MKDEGGSETVKDFLHPSAFIPHPSRKGIINA
jgi:hypothetical protein